MACKKVRFTIDDKAIAQLEVIEIIEPLWWSVDTSGSEEKYESDLKPFTLPQRYAFAIQWYTTEACSGGHYKFFRSSIGIVWEDALRGFEAIGATENMCILKAAAARMGGTPSKIRDTRREQLKQHNCDFGDLDALLKDNKREEAMMKLLRKYIIANASSFYFDGDIPL